MTQEERTRLTREANLRIPGAVKPTADALIRLCELNDAYIDAVIAELPTVEGVKSFDWGIDPHGCHDRCNHAVHFKAYTGRQISDIERAFRAAVGSAAVEALLDDEELWIMMAAGMDNEGAGSPLPPARESIANVTAEWAYEQAKKTWNENFRRYGQQWAKDNPLSASALSITSDTGWLNRMNKEGYKLVRDKIKLEYLPRIKEIIGTQAAEQVPWNQIASNLRKEMQFGKRWDWVRLVRTEMKHGSYIAQMEQYAATGIPFVRWSTSRGGDPCEQCQELNGKIFRLNSSTNMLFNESGYDPESDKLQVCPPPVHPQCRCVQIPVWGKPKVKAPSIQEFNAMPDPESPKQDEPIDPNEVLKLPPKVKINEIQFRSTRKPAINDAFKEVLTNSDGSNEIINEYGTNVSLRSSSECKGKGASNFIAATGKGGKLSDIGLIGTENGHVTIDNKRFNVKIKAGDVIEFNKFEPWGNNPYNLKLSDVEGELSKLDDVSIIEYQGRKIIAMGGGSQKVVLADIVNGEIRWNTVTAGHSLSSKGKNIATVITHESGHLIQNKYDQRVALGGRPKMKELMDSKGITLKDGISKYGMSNESEFFAELYTAYIYNKEALKQGKPKLFDFIEELLFKTYGINPQTIIFAE